MAEKLLEVNDLRTYFYTRDGTVPAVDGISFDINKGESLGLVGESGCGKSVTSLSILQLIPIPPGKYETGEILFQGEDLLKKSILQMRKIRGNKISMVFQEPMNSLNPVLTIGRQLSEIYELHQDFSHKDALAKAVEMLKLVGIASPEKRIYDYPHQLSGGMKQRAMIAMALACKPQLLIADEPTTALDVTIQAQNLELIKDLKEKFDMATLLVTHDLAVVAEMVDKVVVMYAGNVVEKADVKQLFKNPQHPYTKGLLASIPNVGEKKDRLAVIEGNVPRPTEFPGGCRFHPRCNYMMDQCAIKAPPFKFLDKDWGAKCWLLA